MYYNCFRFAKLVLKIESTLPILLSTAMEAFVTDETHWDYRICVSAAVNLEFELDGYGSLRIDGTTFHLCLNANAYDRVSVIQILSFLPVRQMLFAKDMVVLHASFVLHQGEAVLFSGDSGVGKSTQAALWRDCLGSRIINGDRALIYMDNGTAYASGWFQSGTSGICERGAAPVKAIVFPEQGHGNEVSSVSGLDAFKRIICQCSYETNNRQQILKVTEIVARLLNDVPVYHYRCDMEPDAAEHLKTFLYG